MRDALMMDLRLGVRTLRRSPAFTAAATVVLALGIGVSAGVFSAVDSLLLRPLPYADGGRVVSVAPLAPGISVSKATLARLRERQHSLASLAGYSRWGFMVRSPDGTNLVQGAIGTADLFAVLGVRAQIGRTFMPADDQPGRTPVVVLSHGHWLRQYGASPDVIGRSVTLNGVAHTIVGVMGPSFAFPTSDAELWTPTVLDPADRFDYASAGYLLFVGRMRSGISVDAANADLRDAARSMRGTFPDAYPATFGDGASVIPLRDAMLGSTKLVMMLAFGAVGLVVLITCANVGNLVLARASTRHRDLAVRRALGASRRNLIRMVLAEMMILGLLAGLVGTVVAAASVRAIVALLPAELPGAMSIAIDGRVLLFTAALSIVTGLACGMLPALRLSSDLELAERFKAGGGRVTGDAGAQRTMGALLVIESATALLLAVAAGLMLQTVWRLSRESTGFRHDRVIAFDVVLPSDVTTPERQVAFYDALHAALSQAPGVVSVGTANPLPFSGSNQTPELSIDGVTSAEGQTVDWRRVSPGYFTTMGIPLRRGRLFDANDAEGSVPVALVNETLARQRFAGGDAIGRRVRTVLDGRSGWVTIVGVVGDTRVTSLVDAPPPQMYRPMAQRPASFSSFVVRTAGDPGLAMRAIPTVVHSVDRDAVWFRIRPVRQMLGESFSQRRTLATMLSAFAFLALTLGSCGVSALAAYRVSQRRREIAVRIALGAAPGNVARAVVRQSLSLTAAGAGVGLVAALAMTQVLRSQLHGVAPADPATLVGVAALLCCTTLAAVWAPARAAARVDPASALRES